MAKSRPAHSEAKGLVSKDPPIEFQADSLGYAIKRAQVRSYDVFFRVLGPDSISPARMTALSMIGDQDGISQSALAERLGIARASIVKVVDALEAAGLIERKSVPEDRRSYALSLTRIGRTQLIEYGRQVAEVEKALAVRLTESERRQLIELLGKVGRD